jgi:hypothetical protein
VGRGSVEPACLCEASDAYDEVKYEEYEENCFDVECPWIDEHTTGKSDHDSTVSCLNGILGFSCLHAQSGSSHASRSSVLGHNSGACAPTPHDDSLVLDRELDQKKNLDPSGPPHPLSSLRLVAPQG